MDIMAKISLQTPHGFIRPGETIRLNETEAHALIARGFAEMVGETPKTKAPASKAEKPDADLLTIIDAMAVLDETGFGKDGKPLVKAVEAVLDRNISQEQRDQAWKRYERDNAS